MGWLDRGGYRNRTKLTWVQWIGAGVERVPLAALKERGIVLTNNSGVHAINIAEHVLAMMLAFTRELPTLIRAQDRHEWTPQKGPQAGGELAGSTLLIVGYGQIGRALAERAVGLGMRVVAISRNCSMQIHQPGSNHMRSIDSTIFCRWLTMWRCACRKRREKPAFRCRATRPDKTGRYLYNIGRGSAIDTSA